MNQEDFNQLFMKSTHHHCVTNESNLFVCVHTEILSKSSSDIFGIDTST